MHSDERPCADSAHPQSPAAASPPVRRLLPFPLARWVFPLLGLGALLWFLVRVLPKPSRAAYPCQRAAFPIASAFVLWVAGVLGAAVAWARARRLSRAARPVRAAALAVTAAALLLFALTRLPLSVSPANTVQWTPSDSPLTPIGQAQGLHPGRVVWVHDPAATSWSAAAGTRWWENAYTDQAVVDRMVSDALQWLTGEATDAAAWAAIFRSHNRAHGRGDVGYQSGEKIAIKLNLNTVSNQGTPGTATFNTPQVVSAVLRQLINHAGVPGANITLYDASRPIPAPIYDVANPLGVKCVDKSGGNGRILATPDEAAPIHFAAGADLLNNGSFYPPTCVTGAAYLINVPVLKGHNLAGVTVSGKNHFGSIWQPDGGFTPGKGIHKYIRAYDGTFWPEFPGRPMGSYNAFVDIMGHAQLGAKTLLVLVDGLYGAANQSSVPAKWQSSPFNNDWTSSLILSQDAVAADSVTVDILTNEPTITSVVYGTLDNYLHEAALAHAPPSGTVYDPEGDGTRLASLGVHEHWRSASDRRYSRNLGMGEGIELLTAAPSPVVGRHVFYNASRFDGGNPAADLDDDSAIAPDKHALLPGGVASFRNYTSYAGGINGIMIDIKGLPGVPTLDDFEFRVGNDNTPDGWDAGPAPAISVREGGGAGGSDRVTLVWPDGAIRNAWLQVTVKASPRTGLTTPDVFYFGNAVGETGDTAAHAQVNATDLAAVKADPHTLKNNPADLTNRCDFNRDGRVSPTDFALARRNATTPETALRLITAP